MVLTLYFLELRRTPEGAEDGEGSLEQIKCTYYSTCYYTVAHIMLNSR